MKQLRASISIDLPDDEFDEAEAKVKIRPLWNEFRSQLLDAGIICTAKLETTWARNTKPTATAATAGRKRGRKPRVVEAATVEAASASDVPGEAA